MTGEKVTAKEMIDRLRRHHVKPGEVGGVFVPEVTHGSAGGRRADAIYIGFYQSRGRHLTGHEIKVSRSDWVHELEQHGKAEVWEQECHAWYVVAPSIDIVRPEELPTGWGLMVIDPRSKTRLNVVVKAAEHPERNPSWDAMHSIVQKVEYQAQNIVAVARQEVNRRNEHLATSLGVRNAYQYKPDKLIEEIEQRVKVLKDGVRLGEVEAAYAAEKAINDELCKILGVERVSPNSWHRKEEPSVEIVRREFGRWLRGYLLVEEAVGLYANNILQARQKLAEMMPLLDLAREALMVDVSRETVDDDDECEHDWPMNIRSGDKCLLGCGAERT